MSETTIAQPLSGEEISDVILFEVGRALRRDCYLNPVLAYEAFEGEIFVKLRLRDNGRIADVQSEVFVARGEWKEVRIRIEERPPNEVRQQAGLGIPTMVEDSSGKKDVKSVRYASARPGEKEPPPPPKHPQEEETPEQPEERPAPEHPKEPKPGERTRIQR